MITIIPNTSRNDYDSLSKENLNYSRFKHFLDTPAHLVAYDRAEREQSSALMFGDALHTLSLEGDGVFHDSFAILPEGLDRRTKEGKAIYEEFKNSGKKLISQDDYTKICMMEVNLRSNDLIKPMMVGGNNEVTLVGEILGVKVKARLDRMTEEGDIIDLKSMNDIPTTKNFRSTIFQYKYYVQAAFYSMLVKEATGREPKFYFIAMEKADPYSVRVFTLDEEFLNRGKEEIVNGLKYYKACVESNFWPSFGNVVSEIKLNLD